MHGEVNYLACGFTVESGCVFVASYGARMRVGEAEGGRYVCGSCCMLSAVVRLEKSRGGVVLCVCKGGEVNYKTTF